MATWSPPTGSWCVSSSRRAWFADVFVTPLMLRDADVDVEAFMLRQAPDDAGPSHIERIYVRPSDVPDTIYLEVIGRENA